MVGIQKKKQVPTAYTSNAYRKMQTCKMSLKWHVAQRFALVVQKNEFKKTKKMVGKRLSIRRESLLLLMIDWSRVSNHTRRKSEKEKKQQKSGHKMLNGEREKGVKRDRGKVTTAEYCVLICVMRSRRQRRKTIETGRAFFFSFIFNFFSCFS